MNDERLYKVIVGANKHHLITMPIGSRGYYLRSVDEDTGAVTFTPIRSDTISSRVFGSDKLIVRKPTPEDPADNVPEQQP